MTMNQYWRALEVDDVMIYERVLPARQVIYGTLACIKSNEVWFTVFNFGTEVNYTL